jgi:hypothetical protein
MQSYIVLLLQEGLADRSERRYAEQISFISSHRKLETKTNL